MRRPTALLLVACLVIAHADRLAAKPARVQVIGYFTEGGAKSGTYTVKNVVTSGAAARLTQLNYAFGRVADDRCQIENPEVAVEHAYSTADSVDGTDDPAGANQLRGT